VQVIYLTSAILLSTSREKFQPACFSNVFQMQFSYQFSVDSEAPGKLWLCLEPLRKKCQVEIARKLISGCNSDDMNAAIENKDGHC